MGRGQKILGVCEMKKKYLKLWKKRILTKLERKEVNVSELIEFVKNA